MNLNENMKYIKPAIVQDTISKFCLTIGMIPSSYKLALTYEEQLLLIGKFIEEQLIPVIDNNAQAVAELQEAFALLKEYVENFFDDLNLQTQIDNKLNEMAESGELAQIMSNYTGLIRVIDTTAELISSTETFYVGELIKTLGYSNVGDNGGAMFRVKDSGTADGYITLEINGDLYAEMIIEDKININSFGADYTGNTDSSAIFNFAFNYLNNRWLNNDYSINTVECSGSYLINSTVTIPVWCRLRGTGYTIFLTNVNGSAFKIGYISQNLPSNFPGNKKDYEWAEIINFEKGGLFKNISNYSETIGLELGTPTSWGVDYSFARTKNCNFRLQNYTIATKFNTYNNYINTFEKVSFESNEINVQFGDSSHYSASNSGENIVFDQCLFAGGNYAFKWYANGFDISVINSSFDFLTQALFYDAMNRGYKYVKLENCHIEGHPVSLVDNFGDYSSVSINYCKIFFDALINDFFTNCNDTFRYDMNNNKFNFPTSTTDNMDNLINYNKFVSKMNYYGNGNKTQTFAGNNILPSFDNIEDGEYTVDLSTNYKIGPFKFNFNSTYLSSTAQVVTDNVGYTGHKSIQFSVNTPTANNVNLNIDTPKIKNKGYDYINLNSLIYNMKVPGNDMNIEVKQYDSEDNLIATKNVYHNNNANTNPNQWHISNYVGQIKILPSCDYFTMQFKHGKINNNQLEPENTIYKIGGLYCFE